jgi:hypothetical protein
VSFLRIFCIACFVDLEVFLFGFLWGGHGWMSCASLCMILTSQTPDLASDSRISVGTLGFYLSIVESRFLSFRLVWGYKYVGIASPRDASSSLWFGCNPFVGSRDRVKGRWCWPLEGRSRAVISVRGGQSTRRPRTVREELADRVFVVFFTCSCEFVVQYVELVAFPCKEFGGRTLSKARTIRVIGQSVFLSALLKVWVAFLDSPRPTLGRSAWTLRTVRPLLRTVRPVLRRLPKFFASWVVLPLCFDLRLVPRVGRSVVITWPWQTRVGIFGCDFRI